MSQLLLKNATIAQLYPAIVQENVDIVIENTDIVAVGHDLGHQYPQAKIKEMYGKLVMPGMVCSHNHFYSGLSRG
ncbi:putative aminohydrolase SsnA, partial [Raoultella ornithinolytica]